MVRRQIKSTRSKVSTTVAPENFEFLKNLVRSGQVQNISEALDQAIATLRKIENRRRLEQATAEYFDRLSPKAEAEERVLGQDLHLGAGHLDFDAEP